MGALQGQTREGRAHDEARWLREWDDGPPEGETLRAVVDRALATLRLWDDGEPTLVVAHGSLLRGLLAAVEQRHPGGGISVANAIPTHWSGTLPPRAPRTPTRGG